MCHQIWVFHNSVTWSRLRDSTASMRVSNLTPFALSRPIFESSFVYKFRMFRSGCGAYQIKYTYQVLWLLLAPQASEIIRFGALMELHDMNRFAVDRIESDFFVWCSNTPNLQFLRRNAELSGLIVGSTETSVQCQDFRDLDQSDQFDDSSGFRTTQGSV